MEKLIKTNPDNLHAIKPFIGGEDITKRTDIENKRFVIDFEGRTEDECRSRWPELLKIVETKVKPDRDKLEGGYKHKWWLFGRNNKAGNLAIRGRERVLACAGGTAATKYFAPTFAPGGACYSQTTCVFSLSTYSDFCVLQSRIHEYRYRARQNLYRGFLPAVFHF